MTKERITTEYFISTGEHDVYYTLWQKTVIIFPLPDNTILTREVTQYMQNLSHSADQAIEKAKEITGQVLTPIYFKGDESKKFHFETGELKFGKYYGQNIYDVMQTREGFDYIAYIIKNKMWSRSNDSLFSYIIENFGDVFNQHIEDKKQSWIDQHSDAINYLVENKDKNDFFASLYRALNEYGKLSDNQLKHVERAYNESLVKRSNCPEGRITDTYVVKSVSLKESYYGVTEKMVLEHKTGYKVYVTVPSNISVKSGDSVTITMTVTVSDNDNNFGFGKRPSKAKVN